MHGAFCVGLLAGTAATMRRYPSRETMLLAAAQDPHLFTEMNDESLAKGRAAALKALADLKADREREPQ